MSPNNQKKRRKPSNILPKTYSRTSVQKYSKKIFQKFFPKNPSKKIPQQKFFLKKNGPNLRPLELPWRLVKLEVPNQRHPSCQPHPSCRSPGEGEAAGGKLPYPKGQKRWHSTDTNFGLVEGPYQPICWGFVLCTFSSIVITWNNP